MLTSIPLSIFYTVTAVFLLSGFYCLKKADKKLNAIVWLPVTALTFMCYNALFAGIINIAHIPVNLISMGIINLIAGGGIWFLIIRKKQWQKYYIHVMDIAALVCITAIVIVCAVQQFGVKLWIDYETSDPSVHFQMAMNVLNTQKVTDMFFSSVNNSLLIGILAPFTTLLKYYKIFILSDIMMFLVSSGMFYALIRAYSKNLFMKVCAIFVTVFYILGYPLNNMIFGFVYLGMGVSLIALLIFLCNLYVKKQIYRVVNIALLMLGCMGLIVCYSLFAPVAYIAVALALLMVYIKKKNFFTHLKAYVIVGLAVFLIPTVLGLYYSYFGYFGSRDGLSAASGLVMEGYIYRDLFMNFVAFLPLAVFGFITRIQKKRFTGGEFVLLAFGLFTAVLFIMGMLDKASSYYYFKNYYVLWMLVFYFLYLGIYYLSEKSKTAVVSYGLVWLLVGMIALGGLDAKVSNRNILFEPEPRSASLFNIYTFNRVKLKEESDISGERLQLYEYVVDNCNPSEKLVPTVDGIDETYWYEALTNQRIGEYYVWQMSNISDYIQMVNQNCDYIVVSFTNQTYLENGLYFNTLDKVYENAYGFIARLSSVDE